MSPKPIGVKDITGVWSFLSSIDWEERWLWCLFGFHLMCFGITLCTLHRTNFQAFLFLILLGLVFFSENLNELAAKHWRSFSNQQYFDSGGLFISIIFSLPLLSNCFIIVINWMWTSWNMMIRLKRAQIKEQFRKEKADQEEKEK